MLVGREIRLQAQIGRVLAALESNGYKENTAVVVWGDHVNIYILRDFLSCFPQIPAAVSYTRAPHVPNERFFFFF